MPWVQPTKRSNTLGAKASLKSKALTIGLKPWTLSEQCMKRSECTDPLLESRILLEVGFQSAKGKEIELPPDLARHLEECESCRQCLPVLQGKAQSANRLEEAQEIARLGASGDPRVLRKEVASGTAFFRPTTQPDQ